ncbi:hypothetical protein [Methylobacterium sp. B1]|uniref:hypothetical protein n=1 Tax=Methylobacterium sp. B1 TaxID=91459 RepID=UPI000A044A7E|nr:hypothetical protein [Methylobacterium sp. B1]
MDRLGDVSGDRVRVECTTCKRQGSYRVSSLIERYGANISQIDLLRHLTASCRYQRAPGAAAPRKYEAGCVAKLDLPKPASLEPPVPPGSPFTIEVWGERGRIEMRLAVIYPLDGAVAAYEAVEGAYPHNEITLRQGIRIVRKRDRLGR